MPIVLHFPSEPRLTFSQISRTFGFESRQTFRKLYPLPTLRRTTRFHPQNGVILTNDSVFRASNSRDGEARQQVDVYFILTNQGTYLRFIILGRLRG